jgi:acyl dehydratase
VRSLSTDTWGRDEVTDLALQQLGIKPSHREQRVEGSRRPRQVDKDRINFLILELAEDFEVGDLYEHPLGRTVTTTNNIWFTLLTQNTAPIHVDHAYSAQTEVGGPLVDSTFTLALVTGQSVTDVSTVWVVRQEP